MRDVQGKLNKTLSEKRIDGVRAGGLQMQLEDYLNQLNPTLNYETLKRNAKAKLNQIFGRYKAGPRVITKKSNVKLDVRAKKPAPKPSRPPARKPPVKPPATDPRQEMIGRAFERFDKLNVKFKFGSLVRAAFRRDLEKDILASESYGDGEELVRQAFDALLKRSPTPAKGPKPASPSPLKLPRPKVKLPKPKAVVVLRAPGRIPLPRRFLPQRYKLVSGPPSKAVGFRLHSDAKKKVVRKGGTITQLRKRLVAYRKKMWSKQLIKLTGASAAQIRKLYQTFIIGQKPSFYLNPVVRGPPKERRKKIIEGAEVKLFPAKRKRKRKRGGAVTGCHFNASGTISGCRFTL